MALVRGIVAAFVLAWSATGQSGGAPSGERAGQVLQRAACQSQLPGAPERGGGPAAADPPARARTGDESGRDGVADRRPGSGGLPLGAGGTADVVLWLAVGAAVVLIAIAVVRAVADRAAPAPPRPVVGRSLAPAAAAVAELPDHERLAASGDYGAAIHALLLHAIASFAERAGAVPPAATSRELLARAPGPGAAALARLVRIVERAWFGGAAAGRAEYEESLLHLRDWTAACRTTPA